MRADLNLGNVLRPVVALAFWKRHCLAARRPSKRSTCIHDQLMTTMMRARRRDRHIFLLFVSVYTPQFL
jgi:hypothetical protein